VNSKVFLSKFIINLSEFYRIKQKITRFNEISQNLIRFQKPKHLSLNQVALQTQSATRIISLTIMNCLTPKVGAKHDLLFNKPASEAYLMGLLADLNSPDKTIDKHTSLFKGQKKVFNTKSLKEIED
jgi:hypothetical protein